MADALVIQSAIEQWDREFGESYPAKEREDVKRVPKLLAFYAHIFHELVRPDNGHCNQCGGHWLFRLNGTWDYLEGEHHPHCIGRRAFDLITGPVTNRQSPNHLNNNE